MITKQHPWKKWLVSIKLLRTNRCARYKVTRKLLNFSVTETKMFISKKNAIKQFKRWLK